MSTLAAAEASGAIPRLAGRQREALRGALARTAAAIQTGDEEFLGQGEGHWGWGWDWGLPSGGG